MPDLQFLTPTRFAEALNEYKHLSEVENSVAPKNGDKLFHAFGPGNTIEKLDKPYERFHDYEQLLLALQNDNPVKYSNLHKGTPFYFLAWLAFDLRNYTKGLFYIDAAIAEDKKHWPHWKSNPAIQFYTLNSVDYLSGRTVMKMAEILDKHLIRFSGLSGVSNPLSRQEFVDGFIKSVIEDNNAVKRSIVSAFYVFLLEFEDLYSLMKTRTAHGGSILPFITHLFTGGLIFESLLKEHYPTKDNGSSVKTLGDIFKTSSFTADFGSSSIDSSSSTLSNILSDIHTASSLYPSLFSVTSKLRNTTGHNVVWDDIFDNSENYKKLFEQEVNAILYVIAKKY